MTTIAIRGRQMAADSLVVCGAGIARGERTKIRRLADGSLIAACGKMLFANLLMDWIGLGANPASVPRREERDDAMALQLLIDGTVVIWDEHGRADRCSGMEFYAAGTGNELAMGAMAMGATAEQAVAVAIRFDSNSGGPITVMEV